VVCFDDSKNAFTLIVTLHTFKLYPALLSYQTLWAELPDDLKAADPDVPAQAELLADILAPYLADAEPSPPALPTRPRVRAANSERESMHPSTRPGHAHEAPAADFPEAPEDAPDDMPEQPHYADGGAESMEL
jgi:hypothetical protein